MTISKKFLFIVQGEGRGHLTQALSVYNILKKHNHTVCHILIGSRGQDVAPFFLKKIITPFTVIDSPEFVFDKQHKKVSLLKSIFKSLFNIRKYIKSVAIIDNLVNQYQPDVVLNFYDFSCGLYFLLRRPKKTIHIAIGHQYFFDHPDFRFPKGQLMERSLIKIGNAFTSIASKKKLCITFRETSDIVNKKLFIIPPLLREEVFLLDNEIQSECYLVYMVNYGYGNDIEDFSRRHPEIQIHCFWNHPTILTPYSPTNSITFWPIDETRFLYYLSICKGFLTTAGFESLCEAALLDKPIAILPVHGQFEQLCNAIDAQESSIGVIINDFDLSRFIDEKNRIKSTKNNKFKEWVLQAESRLIYQLEN